MAAAHISISKLSQYKYLKIFTQVNDIERLELTLKQVSQLPEITLIS